MRWLPALLLLLLALCLHIAPTRADSPEDREIAYLLEFVRESGCDFVRNGKRHDARDAADHLRSKYRRGRRWVDTAEQFISRIASKSSMSGEAYRVRCADSPEQTSADWLTQALEAQRSRAAEGA